MGKKEIEEVLRTAFEAVEFKRTSKLGIYLYDFNDAIFGWLGLSVNIHRGQKLYTINPNVGVYYHRLEKLWYKLTGVTYPNSPISTASRNIGYLKPTPCFMGYELHFTESLEDIVPNIVSDVCKYGLPWVKELINREKLAEAIMRLNPPDYAAFRLPLYYWLEGKPELLDKTFEHYRQKRGHMAWFAERYDIFEQRFRQLMKECSPQEWEG